MPNRDDKIKNRALSAQLDAVALAELGRPRRRAVPARWLKDPTWRCTNFHVGKTFERDWHDRRICRCTAPVRLTFPRTVPVHYPRLDDLRSVLRPAAQTWASQRTRCIPELRDCRIPPDQKIRFIRNNLLSHPDSRDGQATEPTGPEYSSPTGCRSPHASSGVDVQPARHQHTPS